MKLTLPVLVISIVAGMTYVWFSGQSITFLRKLNSFLPEAIKLVAIPTPFKQHPINIEGYKSQLATAKQLAPEGLTLINVDTDTELRSAIENVQAGQIINLTSLEYSIKKPISTGGHGTLGQPIWLSSNGSARINVYSEVGLKLLHSHWVISGLTFDGVCGKHVECEHAIQIVGSVKDIKITNNRFENFNAHIKSNGLKQSVGASPQFPSSVLISGNYLTNDSIRDTENPVTPIDIVGGNDFTVTGNYIADFAKAHGNKIAYGAFMKGGGRNGVFSNNLVVCSDKLAVNNLNDVRIGLSFGGGTTGLSVCQSTNCEKEHYNGKVIQNTIVNCSYSPAIYLNKVAYSTLLNNRLINSHPPQFKDSEAAVER